MSTDMDRAIPRPRWRSRRVWLGVGAVLGLGVLVSLGASFLGATQRSVRVAAASVTIDRTRIYIDNVAGILGMLQAIVAQHQESV